MRSSAHGRLLGNPGSSKAVSQQRTLLSDLGSPQRSPGQRLKSRPVPAKTVDSGSRAPSVNLRKTAPNTRPEVTRSALPSVDLRKGRANSHQETESKLPSVALRKSAPNQRAKVESSAPAVTLRRTSPQRRPAENESTIESVSLRKGQRNTTSPSAPQDRAKLSSVAHGSGTSNLCAGDEANNGIWASQDEVENWFLDDINEPETDQADYGSGKEVSNDGAYSKPHMIGSPKQDQETKKNKPLTTGWQGTKKPDTGRSPVKSKKATVTDGKAGQRKTSTGTAAPDDHDKGEEDDNVGELPPALSSSSNHHYADIGPTEDVTESSAFDEDITESSTTCDLPLDRDFLFDIEEWRRTRKMLKQERRERARKNRAELLRRKREEEEEKKKHVELLPDITDKAVFERVRSAVDRVDMRAKLTPDEMLILKIYAWWHRLATPNREEMKRRIGLIPGCDMSVICLLFCYLGKAVVEALRQCVRLDTHFATMSQSSSVLFTPAYYTEHPKWSTS